jgi:hypothetical protein
MNHNPALSYKMVALQNDLYDRACFVRLTWILSELGVFSGVEDQAPQVQVKQASEE